MKNIVRNKLMWSLSVILSDVCLLRQLFGSAANW